MPLIILVAEANDGRLVGFLEVGLRSHADGCNPSRPVGYIEGWYVTEDHRQCGVGRRLLAKAEDWARIHSCVEMASDARVEDPLNHTLPKLQKRLYCPSRFPLISLVVVEIHLLEDRIRELCEKAATVNDSEVPTLFGELQALLADHSASVRYLAAKTLKRVSHEPSLSKAAD
jgi:Acetyltransferase (GNAT) family